jgi:glycosyltransferase involved in cell wall biosynthesis
MLKVLIFIFGDIPKNKVDARDTLDFTRYWPSNAVVDVVGLQQRTIVYTLEQISRLHLASFNTFNRIKNYNLILTLDSTSAFLFASLRSKLGIYRSIPHIMTDYGLPRIVEQFIPEDATIALRLFRHLPPGLLCELLKQTFNPKSVSHIVFHSMCQRSFYRDTMGFSEDRLSYIPFGVETEYFKPESVEGKDYIFAAGEFRDFGTLLKVYEKNHSDLPELRIRSALPPPNDLPPKVNWLPRAPLSTFRDEIIKSRFVIVPLHYTFRSTGVMTCLQSMALGKAVITSRVPPIYGYVVDGKTALYYEPYDQNDLFNKIALLSNDDKLTDMMGEKARIETETKFSVKNYGLQLWNCILSVLKRNEPSF